MSAERTYAVVQSGGHQYRVSEGSVISVDLVKAKVGEEITLDKVFMLGGSTLTLGAPFVKGAKVTATVKEHKRAPKILVFKYKRRKGYKKRIGHRQHFSVIEITKIQA